MFGEKGGQKPNMERTKDNKISYIRKPLADDGYYCFFAALLSLVLGGLGMWVSVKTRGNAPLGAVSLCFCSLLLGLAALVWGFRAFREKEKNYILARIGVIAGVPSVIYWVVMIIVGVQL